MPPPRLHPLARSPLAERLDRIIAKGWAKGWMPQPPLEFDYLMKTGGDGFDPEHESAGRDISDITDFRERLHRLIASIKQEAQLNNLGHAIAYGLLIRAVKQRFELGQLWAGKPDLLNTGMADPILVVGQMRAGTTRVHRLLAADPAHCATRFCDSWNPVPTTPDLRRAKGAVTLFWARLLDPWLETLHPFGAARPDEELGWLASALDHSAYEAQWHIPGYTDFSEGRDAAPVYREFARILRTDAANRGNADRPRVMKVPQFSEDLSQLLRQFPTARVVIAERDDDDTIRSAVSLVANQMAIQSDHVSLPRLEEEWARKIVLRKQRMGVALADFGGPVVRLNFTALNDDWRSEIRRIYVDLGLTMTGEAMGAMAREQTRAAQGDHTKHQEMLESFAG